MTQREKLPVVRQSNELIEASYKIASIGEARLIRMLIAQIKPEDEDFKTYRISVDDFAKFFNLSSNRAYEWVKKAADDLTSRKIRIEKGKSWLFTHWLSSAEYKDGSGYVELCFDGKLKPYLLQLKKYYTQYQLENIIHFKSIHSVRVFELLKSESFKADARGRFSVSISYQELRNRLDVSDEEYLLFKDFRINVIEQAVREININPDITVLDVRYGKTGRKFSEVTFHCEQTKQTQLDLEEKIVIEAVDSTMEHPDYINDLVSFGVDKDTAYKWKKRYKVSRIQDAVAYTKAMQKEGRIHTSISGFVAKAVVDGIGSAWLEEQRVKEEAMKKKASEEKEVKRREKEEERRRKEENDRVWGVFLSKSESEQKEFIEKRVVKTADTMRIYREKGINSPFIRSLIISEFKKDSLRDAR